MATFGTATLQTGSIVTVTDKATLDAAIAAATGGETILLEDGYYGNIVINYRTFSPKLTIKAINPSGAELHSLSLGGTTGSHYIRLENLYFHWPLTPEEEAQLPGIQQIIECLAGANSTNIEIINCEFAGSIDENYGNDVMGINAGGLNWVIKNCTFHDLALGIAMGAATNLIVEDNRFYQLERDAMNIVASEHVTVKGNIAYDWYTSEAHPDFLQTWSVGQVGYNRYWNVQNNIVLSNRGGGVHGIFMQNNWTNVGNKIMENMLFENNLIYSDNENGLKLEGQFSSVDVRYNTLVSFPGGAGYVTLWFTEHYPGDTQPNCRAYNNISWQFWCPNEPEDNNLTVQDTLPGGPNYSNNLFIDLRNVQSVEQLLPVPGSAIDFDAKLGAWKLLSALPRPPVYVREDPGIGIDSLKTTLTALPYPGGGLPNDAQFIWDFGDGSATEAGASVEHTFATQGTHEVSGTITRAAGGSYSKAIMKTVKVVSPFLIDMTLDNTIANTGQCGGAPGWTGTPSYSGDAALFDGTGASIPILTGATPALSDLLQLTVSAEFKANATVTNGYLVELYSAFEIRVASSNNSALFVVGGKATLTKTATSVWDTNWHELRGIYDSITGTATMYLDGVSVATATGLSGRTATPATNRFIRIGSDGFGKNFNGLIRNVKVTAGIVLP